MDLAGEKKRMVTSTGFPQGGVCSASFWIVAFDPAIRIINKYGIVGNGFADDCAAVVGGTRPKNMMINMQKMLNELVEWGKSCGLTFHPKKSAAVFFSRRTAFPMGNLKIEGNDIPFESSVKYLGVQLDSRLHWGEHISLKIEKCKKLLHTYKAAARANFGPQPQMAKLLYTGCLLYTSPSPRD